MADTKQTDTLELRLVRVWFGQNVIAKYVAEPVAAQRYEAAMGRRFAGLQVTNEPIPPVDPQAQPLPSQRLWEITPH